MNSFTFKQLRVTFILAGTNQKFPGTGSNTLVLTNLRVAAKVEAVAKLSTQASIKVWGMLPADMNALTVAWANPPVVLDHVVILEAKYNNDPDPTRGWVQVFSGTIIEAQPEFRGAPDVYFQCLATVGYFQKIEPAEPTSYPGSTDVQLAAGDIIERMGFVADVSPDITAILSSPYFTGTLFDQLTQVCNAGKCDFYFQGNKVIVTPQGVPRSKQPAVVLSQDTGLIGYPVYERAGLIVTAIYDSALLCGTAVEVQSIVPSATGRWYPIALTHILETTPKGNWLTQMQCLRVLV